MKSHLLAGSMIVAAALAVSSAASAATPSTVPATQSVSFSVYLPLRNQAAMKALLVAQQTKGSASYRKWLTPAQASAQFGPDAATVAQLKSALTAAGFQVTGSHMMSVDVTGSASAVNKAFSIVLQSVPSSTGAAPRIVTSSKLVVPQPLASLGAVVPSFAFVPEHQPLSHSLGALASDNRNGPAGSYNYNDLKQAYDYPSYQSLDGTGVNVAVVMSGQARNEDVAAMFTHENYQATTGKAPPTFVLFPIDGGGVYGGVNDGNTDEAELDVQMALGGAPGATVTQLSIPNLADAHIFHAYDQVIDSGAYDIVSNSFGECESFFLPAYNNGYDFTSELVIYDEYYAFGSLEGTTWLVSSGDQGGPGCPSTDIVPYFVGRPTGKIPHYVKGVSTPASDPNVTSVGGGNLVTTFTVAGALNSAYVSEAGFGDPEIPYDEFGVGVNSTGGYWGAGGGISGVWAQPSYQTLVNTRSAIARTVPDVGMLVGGCPGGITAVCGPDRSAVVVTIGAPAGSTGVGFRFGFIGTSVASPEFAGALALLDQALTGRVGNINPGLYTLSAQQIAAGGPKAPAALRYFHQNIPGNDGAWAATTGYDYIYGNGSPDVRVLFGLTGAPSAGVPRTASNP